MSSPAVRVADALVAVLHAAGVDRVTSVAGESYLALLDALRDSGIDVVTCRQEGSAGFMALADAKLTGRPGVCLVNRGPGAANAAVALHSADQDASPLVLIVGHVPRPALGQRVFQELDLERTLGGMVKAVWTVHDPDRAAATLADALHVSASPTAGPTVVGLPEDVLQAAAAAPPPAGARPVPAPPPPADVVRAAELLAGARRPLLLAGETLANARGRAALRRAAEQHGIPVVTSNKHQDLLDNLHPLYVGHLHIATRPAQRAELGRADLVLAAGARIDDTTSGRGSFPRWPAPDQPLVHVHPDPLVAGRATRTALAVAGDAAAFLEALAAREPGAAAGGRDAWAEGLHDFERDQAAWTGGGAPDGIPFGAAVAAVGERAATDAVVTVDAGNFTSWVHRHFRFRDGTLLGIGSSAMGFGVPAGVAAALRHPHRQVITFVGDGGMLMTGAELATAVQRRARVRIVIANNSSYGTIRQHQELAYPGRPVATDLTNPDFAALARSFGAAGFTVADEGGLGRALDGALESPGPAVIDVRTSLSRISAYQSLGGELVATPGRDART